MTKGYQNANPCCKHLEWISWIESLLLAFCGRSIGPVISWIIYLSHWLVVFAQLGLVLSSWKFLTALCQRSVYFNPIPTDIGIRSHIYLLLCTEHGKRTANFWVCSLSAMPTSSTWFPAFLSSAEKTKRTVPSERLLQKTWTNQKYGLQAAGLLRILRNLPFPPQQPSPKSDKTAIGSSNMKICRQLLTTKPQQSRLNHMLRAGRLQDLMYNEYITEIGENPQIPFKFKPWSQSSSSTWKWTVYWLYAQRENMSQFENEWPARGDSSAAGILSFVAIYNY